MDSYLERQRKKFLEEMEPVRERLVDIITKHDYGNLRFTLVPNDDDIRLLETYPNEIKAWRDFMLKVYADPEDDWNEANFHDVCRGFMAAKAVNVEDAYRLATFCRYNLQDFEYDQAA